MGSLAMTVVGLIFSTGAICIVVAPQTVDRQWWRHKFLAGGFPPRAIYVDQQKDGKHRIQLVHEKGQILSWYATRVPRWVERLQKKRH